MPPGSHFCPLEAVIHVEFGRMCCHSESRDVFHLQVDIRVDEVIAEDPACFQEFTIQVEGAQSLIQ